MRTTINLDKDKKSKDVVSKDIEVWSYFYFTLLLVDITLVYVCVHDFNQISKNLICLRLKDFFHYLWGTIDLGLRELI